MIWEDGLPKVISHFLILWDAATVMVGKKASEHIANGQ